MLSSEDPNKNSVSKRTDVGPSSQSKRLGSKESPSRRKIKMQLNSGCSSRQQQNSTDAASSSRQQVVSSSSRLQQQKKTVIATSTTTNNDSLDKRSAELISVRTGRHSAEVSSDRGKSSRRERQKSAEGNFVESRLQKVKRIFSGEKIDAPPQKDAVNHLCSDTFGYGPEFMDSWLDEPLTVEVKVERPKKVPVIKVSKTLIIYEVPTELSTKIEIGDILYKFNDLPLRTRDEYTRQLSFTVKNPHSQTISYTILRPIRSLQIPEIELCDVFSSLQQPQGFEILPGHFDYFTVFLTIAPKTTLGLTIKGYNGKVYVSGIENKITSIAYKCLLVGDAILAIEDQALSGVKETDELLCTLFAKKKFVQLIVERAKTPAGLRSVKHALSVEKTFELNPRMTDDVTDICQRQITFMNEHAYLQPTGRIIHQKNLPRPSTSRVNVASESTELPISTDVNNLQLLAPTPPTPRVAPGTLGTFKPLERKESNVASTRRVIKKKR